MTELQLFSFDEYLGFNAVFTLVVLGHEMPVGIRGLIIAGVFATMMGSTSAALNALASIVSVLVLCRIEVPAIDLGELLRGRIAPAQWSFGGFLPPWWPAIAWPYYVLIGTITTFGVSALFRASRHLAPEAASS